MNSLLPRAGRSLGLLLFLSAVASISAEAAPRQRPNVIMVLTDDQGYGDLGCHGNTMIRTPNLDRLHGESVRLANFHSDPTCSPTRASLMTGRYSTRTGVWHTILGRSLLYHDEVTMADIFKAAGYRTGIFGKWHLGDNYPMRPQDRGFDEVIIHGGGGIGQTPDHWGNTYWNDTYFHNGKPEKFEGYCTDVFFGRAMQFVEENREDPFFLYIPTNAPHWPYNVDERYSRPYIEKGVRPTMAAFYGMVENIDENMGRLLKRLEDLGLAENTIVIFATDNGTAAGAGGAFMKRESGTWPGYNAGLRGSKGSAYDGGHRVPCFIRWPAGDLGGGRDIASLTAHFDLLPTLIDLCGLEKPKRVAFDGRSLTPLLKGRESEWPERTLFVHVQRGEIPPKWVNSAVLTERWRFNHGSELYDITKDPGQASDVAAKHPSVVKALRSDYEEWWSSLTPAFERFAYVVVGSEHENPSMVTCHDWHSDGQVPWHHGLIEKAEWVNGYWMIDVARPGRYEITLRQQPVEAAFAIEATEARVEIGDRSAASPVKPGATSVTLPMTLHAGPARLQTWFTGHEPGKSRGAFFVEIRRVN